MKVSFIPYAMAPALGPYSCKKFRFLDSGAYLYATVDETSDVHYITVFPSTHGVVVEDELDD